MLNVTENELIPKLIFKYEYILEKFISFLHRNEIPYSVENNEVIVLEDIVSPRFVNNRSIYDVYLWFNETYKPKKFKFIRRIFNKINNLSNYRWIFITGIVILFLSVTGRYAVDNFNSMSYIEKIGLIINTKNNIENISETLSNKNNILIQETIKEKLFMNQSDLSVETITNTSKRDMFPIIINTMLFLLSVITGIIIVIHKEDLIKWSSNILNAAADTLSHFRQILKRRL